MDWIVKVDVTLVRPKRIAFQFYDRPNYTAGPRINALRLLPELSRRGHAVTAVIGYQRSCPSESILNEQGIATETVLWPPFCDDQVRWFANALMRIDPDIFVPNISTSGCYAARYIREAGRPTIAGHLSDDEFNWGMAERFCKSGDQWAVSALFCMGKELGDVVRSWRPKRTEVVEICHGVPLKGVKAESSGPLRIVYAGRMEQSQKRIADVAQCAKSVLERHPEAQMRFIGDGSRLEATRQYFRDHHLADRVSFTGYVAPDEVQAAIAWGNTIVLLSDYEGVPAAIMDGMACGLVPVCLEIDGGLRELVIHERTGLLIGDRNEEFLRAIDRLAADEGLRAKFSENAIKHIRDKYSLSATADRWEQLFERLTQRAGPRRDISFPNRIRLPKPYSKLSREDLRPSLRQRVTKRLRPWRV